MEIPNGISIPAEFILLTQNHLVGKFFDLEDNWNVKQIFLGKGKENIKRGGIGARERCF